MIFNTGISLGPTRFDADTDIDDGVAVVRLMKSIRKNLLSGEW